MGNLILHNPQISIDEVVDGTPAGAPADISCHVGRVEITVDQDEKEAATFCDPTGTEPGPPAFTADVDWRLQRDGTDPSTTYDVLADYVGKKVRIQMKALTADTDALTFDADFGVVNPGAIGAWEAGEVVEASTSHKVDAEPIWSTWVAVV